MDLYEIQSMSCRRRWTTMNARTMIHAIIFFAFIHMDIHMVALARSRESEKAPQPINARVLFVRMRTRVLNLWSIVLLF